MNIGARKLTHEKLSLIRAHSNAVEPIDARRHLPFLCLEIDMPHLSSLGSVK